jgi:putative ABC transport system permease protein
MILIDLMIAARNLARHTKRNVMLGGALAAVTALLVLMGGLGEGVRRTLFLSATTLMTGHVNVGGFYKFTSGTGSPLVSDAARVQATAVRDVPELAYATQRVRGYAKAVAEKASMDLVLGGIDIETEPQFRTVVQMKEGRLADLAQPNTILIFEEEAKRLEVKTGDAITLSAPTARGVSNTADVRIVGVGRSVGMLSSFSAYLPSETSS